MSDRRLFLSTLMGGATLVASGSLASQLGCRKADAIPGGDARPTGDLSILNGALILEHTAIYAYGLAGGSGLLSKGVLSVGGTFKASHETHREALTAVIRSLGGAPADPKKEYDFNAFELKTEADVLRLAIFLEMKAARAYQSAINQFRTKALLDAAARIMGDEVSHAVILRAALGKPPVGFFSQIDELE